MLEIESQTAVTLSCDVTVRAVSISDAFTRTTLSPKIQTFEKRNSSRWAWNITTCTINEPSIFHISLFVFCRDVERQDFILIWLCWLQQKNPHVGFGIIKTLHLFSELSCRVKVFDWFFFLGLNLAEQTYDGFLPPLVFNLLFTLSTS